MIEVKEANHKYILGCTLAIIIPVYNEEKTVTRNVNLINQVLENDGIIASIVLIDDGSQDNTWLELVSLVENNSNVFSLRFSRNFGKEAAIFAGLAHVDADYYVVMDSDLQHPPRYIKQMLTIAARDQVDIVEAVKTSRGKESLSYRLFAKGFYKFLAGISGLELDNSSDFKLLNRRVVNTMRTFNEGNVFFRGLTDWTGFSKTKLSFVVEEREGDTSRFSTGKLVLMALNAALSYSSKPLYLTVFLGVMFFVISVILTIQTIYNYVIGYALSGFSTVIILILFTGSITMLTLGIIGAYISRIYNEVKARPRYIISDTACNHGEKGINSAIR